MRTKSKNQPLFNRDEEGSGKGIVYGLVEEKYFLGECERVSYGISAYADSDEDGSATILRSVHDVTSDRSRLEETIRICNRIGLSAEHLSDVIEDFLSE